MGTTFITYKLKWSSAYSRCAIIVYEACGTQHDTWSILLHLLEKLLILFLPVNIQGQGQSF